MIVEFVRSLFAPPPSEREPLLIFAVPGIHGTFGLYLPILSLYLQMFLVSSVKKYESRQKESALFPLLLLLLSG
jgi:hypothetical protein